jgi:hypothetical protein
MTDFKKIIGKLCLDISYAIKFFENRELALAGCNLTLEERKILQDLNRSKLDKFLEQNVKMSCDCDSCCNGGEGSGNCSECSTNCCQ